jgi:hypothetical protein
MISIIRIQSQGKADILWDEILKNKNALQSVLDNRGKMLYLSKRAKYNEVSLFLHIADANILGDFIAQHLAKLNGVDSLWLINMLKPVFFPFPKDARRQKRYTVTVKAYPPRLSEIYSALANLAHSETVAITYLAYTCHLFGDCIQLSLQAADETDIPKYVSQVIDNIPGVLKTTACAIEKTHPFTSYEEWQKYISQNAILVDWNEQNMVAQFQA